MFPTGPEDGGELDELERRLADLIARIRQEEPAAFEELGELMRPLSAFYLIGAGVGLHGSKAADLGASWIIDITASAHAATEPYRGWVEHQFEQLVHRDFFGDAAALQKRIFCEWPPLPVGVKAHAVVRPRQRVSGDLILVDPSEREVWFAVGDVTGHGTAAAIYGSLALRLLQVARGEAALGAAGERLAAVALAVNREILRTKIGITALPIVLAWVDTADQIVEVLNCGSVAPPVFLRGGSATGIDSAGPPLGYVADPNLRVWRETWQNGDILILPTDGLVEQRNPAGEMFSAERLIQYGQGVTGSAPDGLAQQIFAAVDHFADGAPQEDDQALLVVRLGN